MVRLAVIVLVALGALASAAAADTPTLMGMVGPDFMISLGDSTGNSVNHLDAGAYTVNVDDEGTYHNFHLLGPGVDMKTSVDGIEMAAWQVTLAAGTYQFLCDAHPQEMHGTFTVGSAAPVTPPTTTTPAKTTPPPKATPKAKPKPKVKAKPKAKAKPKPKSKKK